MKGIPRKGHSLQDSSGHGKTRNIAGWPVDNEEAEGGEKSERQAFQQRLGLRDAPCGEQGGDDQSPTERHTGWSRHGVPVDQGGGDPGIVDADPCSAAGFRGIEALVISAGMQSWGKRFGPVSLLVTIHQQMESTSGRHEGNGAHASIGRWMKVTLGGVTSPLRKDRRDGIGWVSQGSVGRPDFKDKFPLFEEQPIGIGKALAGIVGGRCLRGRPVHLKDFEILSSGKCLLIGKADIIASDKESFHGLGELIDS